MNMLKKALKAACYSFVGLTVFYAFLMLCIYEGDVYMSALTVFTFFPLAFFVSLANIFVKDSKKSGAIKLLVHFIIVTLSLVFFIFLPHGGGVSSGSAFIIFAVYVVLYAIGAVIYGVIKSKNKANKEKVSDYKKVY